VATSRAIARVLSLSTGLLARIGLRDQQLVHVDAELLGVARVECVLGIDKSRRTAEFLGLGNDLQRQRGLAGRFGTIDLDHAPARQATDAECDIEADGTARNRLDIFRGTGIAHAHDGTLAELFLDLAERLSERLFAILIHGFPYRSALMFRSRLFHKSGESGRR
jgi:hypothetical protein